MGWRDRGLVKGLLSGDRTAQGRLLEEIYPRLFSYLCHLCGSQEKAADLAQETAARIWRTLPEVEFRGNSSLLAWAHKIAYHIYLDSLCNRPDITPSHLVDLENLPAPNADPADKILAQTDGQVVLAAVSRLSEIYRQVIVLRFLQGLAYREVAGVLEIPPGTVRSRLAKALDLLREDLTGKENRDEM
jgi:RNA polymerase sigma-70 factor, ECF subfamily